MTRQPLLAVNDPAVDAAAGANWPWLQELPGAASSQP